MGLLGLGGGTSKLSSPLVLSMGYVGGGRGSGLDMLLLSDDIQSASPLHRNGRAELQLWATHACVHTQASDQFFFGVENAL